MFGMGELLCVDLLRSVSSPLPQDIPWYDPSHAVFFTALYGALGVIGIGLVSAVILTFIHMKHNGEEHH